MRTLTILLVTLVVLTALSAAQLRQQSPLQPGRSVPGTEIPVEGVVHKVVTPAFAPRSLEELVKEADVIVDGVVESQLPSRLEDPREPTSIETDVILEVTKVLKGRSHDLRKLVIAEVGGKFGNVEVVPTQYALLQPGERHILFLNPDRRSIVPSYTAVDGNFIIVGVWSGNFKVESNNSITPSPRVVRSLRNYNGVPADTFVSQILGVLGNSR